MEKVRKLLYALASKDKIERIIHYLEILMEWNQKMNLISRKIDWKEFIEKNITDCILLYNVIKESESTNKKTILDVGTGAGLPGIILSIMSEGICEYSFTLLDKNSKKGAFVTYAIAQLELKNTKFVCNNVIDFYNTHDIIVSKATMHMKNFMSLTSHLLQDKTKVFLLKNRSQLIEISESGINPRAFALCTYRSNYCTEQTVIKYYKN